MTLFESIKRIFNDNIHHSFTHIFVLINSVFQMACRGLKCSIRKCSSLVLLIVLLVVVIPILCSLVQNTEKVLPVCQYDNTSYLKMWQNMDNISKGLPQNLSMFKMRLKKCDLSSMLEMLDDFSKTMDKHNLTYFMDAGTLLGSYRHHGMIPWDDDIDLFADVEQYKQVRTALDTIKDKYVVSVHSKALLKVHSRIYSRTFLYESNNWRTYAWKWPFLDIFWFQKNGKTIYKLFDHSVYNISDIFPLAERPFGTIMLKSPCNTELFLKLKFKFWNICATPNWSHMKERETNLKKVKQDCGVMYPVVQRTHLKNGSTLEYLSFNNATVSSFIVNSIC